MEVAKMFIWITHDGAVFHADGEDSLLDAMRRHTHTPENTVEEFMKQATKWTHTYNKVQLDPSSPAAFVASMLDAGLITRYQWQ